MSQLFTQAILETARLDDIAKVATLIAVKAALFEVGEAGGPGIELRHFLGRVEHYAGEAVEFLIPDE